MSEEATDWVSPETLRLDWLGPTTPPGLFLATEAGNILLWITPNGRAVRLADDDASFYAWQPEEDGHAYAGIHLGEVELELDAATISSERYPARVGELLIRNGQLLLVSRGDHPGLGVPRIPVGTVAGADRFPHAASCTRWALIRAGTEDRVEVFRRDPPLDDRA